MIPGDLKTVELIVVIDKEHPDASFWQAGRKYRELFLSSTDEEEYFVGDNPIPESLYTWARLAILENDSLDNIAFRIVFTSNARDPRSSQILDELREQYAAHLSLAQTPVLT